MNASLTASITIALILFGAWTGIAAAQQADRLRLPGLNEFSPQDGERSGISMISRIKLAAHLAAETPEIPRGLLWRIFGPEPGPDGKLPLVASAEGGSSIFELAPGSYLVHASFGRAGATKRITLGAGERREENVILDAGGLKLDAVLSGGIPIPPDKLRFSIYEAREDPLEERPLVLPNVSPNAVIRLNAGTYHIVSTYGLVNAVIRSDIRVEAGKLTEATVEHRAAQLTLKLVREPGGEAIADTQWSVLTESGDILRESVGAFASMVLAEGTYTVIAKNRDRTYQRDFSVVAGRNQDVEVLTTE
jgi:hypothetical protein